MNRSTRILAAVFGALAGCAGLEHGVGEILQGPGTTPGILFASWSDAPFFRVVAGEPAMSLFHGMLTTGIFTIAVSIAFIAWTVVLPTRRGRAIVAAVLSVVLLLVGGGFGPPLLGFLVAFAAGRVDAPLAWWRSRSPHLLKGFLAAAWPAIFAATIFAWLLMMPGMMLLDLVPGMPDLSAFVPAAVACAFGGLLLSLVAGFARDGSVGRAESVSGKANGAASLAEPA